MTPVQPLLLVTGAAGRLGAFLRRHPPRGWRLRLTDLAVPDPVRAEDRRRSRGDAPVPQPRWSVLDVTDRAAVTAACEGADAVLHLGGVATNAPATRDLLVPVNIGGTRNVLDAAARAGLRKVVLAGSNHAAGFHRRTPGELLPDDVEPWPDSLYGVTKATMEMLGRHHADQHGADVVLLRIGSCFERPTAPRALSTWLSPGDFCRLVEAALRARGTGFTPVWGVSANTRRWWSSAGGDALGYAPRDDAEIHADALGVPPREEGRGARTEQETVGGSLPEAGRGSRPVPAGPER
jgi:uronate dehydrogenase